MRFEDIWLCNMVFEIGSYYFIVDKIIEFVLKFDL